MNQNLQSGMHPDPDQLSIFMEGTATAKEHERMLAHLAECEECRDAVFLMQPQEETSAAAKQVSKERVWQGWFLPAGLAGAVLACGLTAVLIYVWPWTRVPDSIRENAEVREPEFGTNPKTPVPSGNAGKAVQPERANGGPRHGEMTMNSGRHGAGRAAGSKAFDTGSRSAPEGAPVQGTDTEVPSGSVATAAKTTAAGKPGAQSGVNSAVAQKVPLMGRNTPSLQPLRASPSAQTAAGRVSSRTQQDLPGRPVERSCGQDGALSGVSGRVTDASGAVIPRATVVLRDASGGIRQTATGADGSFQLAGIPAGRYDMTVTASGFMSGQQSIDLKPSELAMLQPVLAVGAATESVTVTSNAPSLQTESVGIGSTAAELPSSLPAASSASLGKRILALDRAGSLFLSRNAGKSWKKVEPQWAGKVVSVDLETEEPKEAKRTSQASSPNNSKSVFRLTTDAGAQWASKDGINWRPWRPE
jgi:hypothetical protein